MADIDIGREAFKINKKGGAQVELPLNTVTTAIVRNRKKCLPKGSEYLFPGMGGKGRYKDTGPVRRIVKSRTKKTGVTTYRKHQHWIGRWLHHFICYLHEGIQPESGRVDN